MKLTESLRLPLRPEAVSAMYTDPAYAQVRARTLGAKDATSEVTGDAAGAFTVVTSLGMSTDRVPDIARRFVGDSVIVRETQEWGAPAADGSRSGTMVIDVVGTPASMRGDLRMRPEGEGATLVEIEGDLSAKIPLIGGKLEKTAMPYVSKVLRAEERSAAAYAEEHRR